MMIIGITPQVKAMNVSARLGLGYAALFLDPVSSRAYFNTESILPEQNFAQGSAPAIIKAPTIPGMDESSVIIAPIQDMRAMTPYVPICESFIIANIRSFEVPPPNPSKKSATPSS